MPHEPICLPCVSVGCLGHLLRRSSSSSKEPKPEPAPAAKLDRLVDGLASRNSAPRIVCTTLNNEVPLFARKYDWAEQKRVSAAVRPR